MKPGKCEINRKNEYPMMKEIEKNVYCLSEASYRGILKLKIRKVLTRT